MGVLRKLNLLILLLLVVLLVGSNLAQVAFGITFYAQPQPIDGNLTEERTLVTTDPPSGGNGKLVLYEGEEKRATWDKYDAYFDVDQTGPNTVEYSAAYRRGQAYCSECTTNFHVRHNIRTNETVVVRKSVEPSITNQEWHDFDVLQNNSYVYADMSEDEVYIYEASTNTTTWEWELYPRRGPETGYGIASGDWSHMNDVEVVRNGTQYMVSLRNQNEIVFISRQNGTIVDSIGGNGTTVVFEQHNPDYIPEENGGPAVVVADSENDRVVEYEKRDGSWVKTWEWRDRYMSWPRDADRLPNNHTLVADTYSNRVVEINENSTKVWSDHIRAPYDAERLGTGDESSGGGAAAAIPLADKNAPQSYPTYSSLVGPKSSDFLVWLVPWLDWWDLVAIGFVFPLAFFEGFFWFNKYLYEPYLDDHL